MWQYKSNVEIFNVISLNWKKKLKYVSWKFYRMIVTARQPVHLLTWETVNQNACHATWDHVDPKYTPWVIRTCFGSTMIQYTILM
jgi:hypothetical protein